MITIIGGGLAGSEAAWQAARHGVPVCLHEMRPVRTTPVHRTDRLAELVCSNSFRGDKLDNAVGLLKAEMRQLDSLVMRVADATRVPAGGALAVDRERFANGITEALAAEPLVAIHREEVARIPSTTDPRAPVIIATGPLTSERLSSDINALVGTEQLYFFDAISPIVHADSIDHSLVFRASRQARTSRAAAAPCPPAHDGAPAASCPPAHDGAPAASCPPAHDGAPAASCPPAHDGAPAASCPPARDGGDYVNCPMDESEYARFYDALTHAELAEAHDLDRTPFFEGCLPIEVMAHRGIDTLRFGPMKPVGLTNPATGRRPYAVVQLRQDNLAADHFSLVGFQTQLKWGEQRRVLRLIPGLANAEFVRFGMIHRNTYINAPTVLLATWQSRERPGLFFAGQLSGVEGYVESAASGLMAGLNAVALARGEAPSELPRTTALGALAYYVSHANRANYQPTNVSFGLMPSLPRPPRGRSARRQAISTRALADLERWREARWGADAATPAIVS